MNDYREANVVKLPTSDRDEEPSRVNRNLGVASSRDAAPQELGPQLPDSFQVIDTRALMRRVRALASQI